MSIVNRALDRLADLLRRDRRITYRAHINARTAPYVVPLLNKIIADDEDGDTLRNSLIPWRRAQRPPIAIYRGDVSMCRIDGPWQVADDHWFPLGGLIVTSGVTAHLNPFEAEELHKRMQKAIEDTVFAWACEHDLYALRHVPDEIDRVVADPAAKALIAAWASGDRQAEVFAKWPAAPTISDSGEPVPALCALCGKGLGHA